MDLATFLCNAGTDLSAILASVQRYVGLESGDELLAVGSLVEGLGNSRSDVDLLLITPRPLPAGEVVVVAGQCIADLQVLPEAQLAELLARLKDWSAQPWQVQRAAPFVLEERRLLHRLSNGALIFTDPANPGKSMRPDVRHVARLKLQIARHTARTIQVDMAGYREMGDYKSLGFCSQDLLGQAIDGLLASHCFTNPAPKWRSQLLTGLSNDWEIALPTKPTGQTAATLMWKLHRLPERPEPNEVLAHAMKVATLSRAVFVSAERFLVSQTRWLPHRVWPKDTKTDSEPLPQLDFDIDFVGGTRTTLVGRLNAVDEPMEVSPEELALILLFDGHTTLDEALSVVWGTAAQSTERARSRDLIDRVSARGWVANSHARTNEPSC